jgi:hypothetical protein
LAISALGDKAVSEMSLTVVAQERINHKRKGGGGHEEVCKEDAFCRSLRDFLDGRAGHS